MDYPEVKLEVPVEITVKDSEEEELEKMAAAITAVSSRCMGAGTLWLICAHSWFSLHTNILAGAIPSPARVYRRRACRVQACL